MNLVLALIEDYLLLVTLFFVFFCSSWPHDTSQKYLMIEKDAVKDVLVKC